MAFFENWCIDVFTKVIIHTDFEKKKKRMKGGESDSVTSLEGNAVEVKSFQKFFKC